MERPAIITQPVEPFVDIDAVKEQVGQMEADDDAKLARYIEAARTYFEGPDGILGVKMVDQTWRVAQRMWVRPDMILPFLNVTAVTVTYQDEDDATQTLAGSDYALHTDHRGARLHFHRSVVLPRLYARPDAVQIEMTAGFGPNTADVPDDLAQAGILLAAHWFRNDEPFGQIMHSVPFGISAMIANYRHFRV